MPRVNRRQPLAQDLRVAATPVIASGDAEMGAALQDAGQVAVQIGLAVDQAATSRAVAEANTGFAAAVERVEAEPDVTKREQMFEDARVQILEAAEERITFPAFKAEFQTRTLAGMERGRLQVRAGVRATQTAQALADTELANEAEVDLAANASTPGEREDHLSEHRLILAQAQERGIVSPGRVAQLRIQADNRMEVATRTSEAQRITDELLDSDIHTTFTKRMRAVKDSGLSGAIRDDVEDRLKDHETARRATVDANEEAFADELTALAYDGKLTQVQLRAIPSSRLSGPRRGTLESILHQKLTRGSVTTDQDVFWKLHAQITSPATRQEWKDKDLLPWANRIAAPDLAKLQAKQQAPDDQVVSSFSQKVEQSLKLSLGLPASQMKWSEDEKAAAQAFRENATNERDRRMRKENRALDEAEERLILRTLSTSAVIDDGWWFLGGDTETRRGFATRDQIDNVPPEARRSILQQFQSLNRPVPDEAQIKEAFFRGLQAGEF